MANYHDVQGVRCESYLYYVPTHTTLFRCTTNSQNLSMSLLCTYLMVTVCVCVCVCVCACVRVCMCHHYLDIKLVQCYITVLNIGNSCL